jgi:acetyl-CoA acetyltransferase/uncharacterized OB-fold protein
MTPRPLPHLTTSTTAYWSGGERGELVIQRCQDCGKRIHPPTGFCPSCESRSTAPEPVSGRGSLASFTVNHQQWEPDLEVPYVMALIELDEDPDIRLVSNIVGCDIDELYFGMPVEVFFEQHDDVWIPLFRPATEDDGGSEAAPAPARESPRPTTRRHAPRVEPGEKQVAISGIGQSEVTRGTDRWPIDLTIDACLEAITDAGLTRADIDGVATWPGGGSEIAGFAPVGAGQLQDALGLDVDWYNGTGETSGQLGAMFNAIGAIVSGMANHVLVFRTVYEAQARRLTPFANAMARSHTRVEGPHSWYAPYWSLAAATQQALFFARYVHESQATPEQIGQIALNGRRNAGLNPKAIYRAPITLDDYLASRWISTPLRLFDCDVPCDGSTAIVLSRIDVARDLRNPPIRIEAVGAALHDRNSWAQLQNLATQATPSPAAMLWNRTDLRPADVDVAELYDGFSFHSLAWLESFGFCGRYEAPAFVEGGHRIALDGEIPINTSGGQLSAGRLHGYGQVHEAAVQLWGRGDARQVGGDPQVAVTSTAGGPLAGCVLLVRE